METKIIITLNWKEIKTYANCFTMSKGDEVEFEDIYYKVVKCYLDITKNQMLILIKEQ